MQQLWDVEQVAQFLGMSPTWVYRHVASGELPHRKIGRAVRFVPAEVERWVRSQPGAAADASGHA